MIKVSNESVKILIGIYETKLMMLDFDTPKKAHQIIKDLRKLKEADSIVNDFRTGLVKKYKLDSDNVDPKKEKKATEEYIAMLLEKIDLDIEPLPEGCIDNIAISPMHVAVLEECKLYNFNYNEEQK